MSKLGVHIVQGPRDGYGDFLRKCSGAGQPVAVVKAVDDFAPCREAKFISPKTITVGRFRATDDDVNLGNNPVAEAGAWWNKWKARAVGVDVSGVDIWETINEISSHWGWQADFYIELARISGLSLALYCTSTGNPPRPEDDGGVAYQAVARCCAALNGRGHVLSLHEYGGVGTNTLTLKGTEPYHALRYRTLAGHLLSVNGSVMPMIISETAQSGGFQYMGLQVFSEDFAWYDSELMKDKYILGATCYTLGNWHNANFQEALPWLGDYIVSHPAPAPTPPPQPPPARTWSKFVLLTPQDTTPAEYDQLQAVALPTKTEIAFSADSAFARPGNVTSHKVAVYAASRWQGGRAGLESFVNQYYKYTTPTVIEYREFGGSVPIPPPPTPLKRAMVGLHLRSNGLDHNSPEFAGELDLIRRGRIQAVKFTSNSSFESLDALINTARIPPDNIVVRLYMAGNDPNLRNPDLFHFYSYAWIAHAISRRVLRLEIHNEPNLTAEGLGFAWMSAAGFAVWYERVRSRIKAEFPQALVGFPGLSPQPNVSEWLSSCAGVIGKSDWVGAHAYWQTAEQMAQAEHGAYWQRYTQFGKPIYLTEFANVAPLSSVSKHEKGLQYVRYYDHLREPVALAFSFVSSAPGGDFPEQTWAGSDIADVVGTRTF